jgi:integrase
MRKTLTERGLKALAAKPAGKQHTIWDAILPGFGVRVSGGGKLAFVVMRRPMGRKKPVRVTLGHYPVMPLDAARKAAQGAIAELLEGKNPTAERDRRIREQQETDATTFSGVCKRYLDHVADKRAVRQIRSIIEREFIPRWDGRPITSIRRREIAEMVDEIVNAKQRPGARKAGGPEAARQTLAYCKRIFSFAVARDLLDASPATAISAEELIGEKRPRQRTLSDSELRAVLSAFPWNTSPVEPQERGRWPIAPMLWLLALLGVRRGELAAATWDRVDLEKATWLIPPEDSKNAEPHLVPLPQMAVRILKSLPRFVGDLIFTTNGASQIGGWSALKNEVDYKSGVTDWTLHDLRRTARTNWSKLGIPPHISEQMLGHKPPAIIGTYSTYDFTDERRAALERWSEYLAEIVSPPPPKSDKDKVVVKLRA